MRQLLAEFRLPTWRVWAVVAALALLLALGGFAAGRWATPPRIETKVETVTKWETKVVEVVKEVKVLQKAATRVVYRDRWVTDAGTHESEREVYVEDSTAKTDTHAEVAKVDTGEVAAKKSKVTSYSKPGWYVGADVGGQWHGKPWLPITGPLVLGVRAERRVVGGLWAGVWLHTSGTVGASLGYSF